MPDFLPTILTSFATAMLTKGAEAPAHTFNELWKFVIGPIDYALMRKNEIRKLNHEQYMKSFVEKVYQIPENNIQMPKISILGPALEASKFYIEEIEIREMFASLLASSFDSTKNKHLHHSFVEFIKQMSPLDAKNLSYINFSKQQPVCKYNLKLENNELKRLHNLVFIPTENITETLSFSLEDYNKNASSLINLERLGLVKIDFLTTFTHDIKYSRYENNTLKLTLSDIHEKSGIKNTVEMTKGIVEITQLGIDFCKICLT